MLFNSLEFLIFFPLVTSLYFAVPHRHRTLLLLLASCAFYMAFVPMYILILGFTIVVDYWAGLWIDRAEGARRRMALIASLIANIGVLALFKYYLFIADNVSWLGHWAGLDLSMPALNIILPIGLSFHTFQAMSYTIEVYRGHQRPERNFLTYALYVMFYPQLVAGPIERPQNLLPQFYEHHEFEYERVVRGLLRIAVGMFKKIVVADTFGKYANMIFDQVFDYQGLPLVLAVVFFAFQIYWDFSAYSDIALGAAEVMGFRLMENFRTPYLAKSIGEFWRRWHISLSTWFRDYVFVSLGGSRGSALRTARNLMIVFLISGLWHGASWTFVIWGALHGLFLIAGKATRPARDRLLQALSISRESWFMRGLAVACTFSLVTFAWVFFRASTLAEARYILANAPSGLFTDLLAVARGVAVPGVLPGPIAKHVLLAALVMSFEFLARRRGERGEAAMILRMPVQVRYAVYFLLIYGSLMSAGVGQPQFIYFQF
jgi:D-alanyl-lipoteichoic acid acyltransferase DltB (MBOAT superfamily)